MEDQAIEVKSAKTYTTASLNRLKKNLRTELVSALLSIQKI